MPTVRRSQVVAAPLDKVWEVASDVHSQPRWWPRVSRMEGVSPHGFTQVMQTKSGRAIRADFRFVSQDAPYTRVWAQELDGTPFERVLRASQTTVRVAAQGDDETRVTLEQKLRL